MGGGVSYLRIVSWHSIARVDAAGWHTRCGRVVTTEDAPASDTLPLGEPTCETCLRLTIHDKDQEGSE